MEKFKVLDTVALLNDRPEVELHKGQVGTIVEKLDEKMMEVEFCNQKGEMISTVPLNEKDLILLHFDPATA